MLDSISAQRYYFTCEGLDIREIELLFSDIECVLPIRQKITFKKDEYAEFAFHSDTNNYALCIENIELFERYICLTYELIPALAEGQRLLLYTYDIQNN